MRWKFVTTKNLMYGGRYVCTEIGSALSSDVHGPKKKISTKAQPLFKSTILPVVFRDSGYMQPKSLNGKSISSHPPPQANSSPPTLAVLLVVDPEHGKYCVQCRS